MGEVAMYRLLDFVSHHRGHSGGVGVRIMKSRPDVYSNRIGITGFFFVWVMTFLTACKLSAKEIAAAAYASQYGLR